MRSEKTVLAGRSGHIFVRVQHRYHERGVHHANRHSNQYERARIAGEYSGNYGCVSGCSESDFSLGKQSQAHGRLVEGRDASRGGKHAPGLRELEEHNTARQVRGIPLATDRSHGRLRGGNRPHRQ